jgi:hypothetical protein
MNSICNASLFDKYLLLVAWGRVATILPVKAFLEKLAEHQ